MFVGHYGLSLAARALKTSIPLSVPFLGVQLLDVLWSILVLLGIEKVRVVPGITATNPLDLYYMPYTHSLAAAVLWAIAGGVAYWLLRGTDGWSAARLVSTAVFSHWVLDLIVHRPDLPLYDSSLKVGLGLWNFPVVAFALETAFLFGGMCLYFTTTQAITPGGCYAIIVFAFVMVAVQTFVFFGPPPTSDHAAAITALALYFVFAGVACWLGKKRAPRKAVQEVLS